MNTRSLKIGIVGMICFFLLPQSVVGAGAPGSYSILVDPAHGGKDSGVVEENTREKDLTLNLALLLREEAKKESDLNIHLTRLSDVNLSNEERIKLIEKVKADCFISLHFNAGFDRKAAGYEVYFPGFGESVNGKGKGNASPILKDMVRNKSLNDSVRLAQNIQSGLDAVFSRKGRGLREAPSPLLNRLSVPGLVVEISFITNPNERKRIKSERTQREVARALLKGLRQYFKKMK